MAIALNSSPDVQGITLFGDRYLLGQYADDTFMFLNGTENSLASALDILDRFTDVSGLKINVVMRRQR